MTTGLNKYIVHVYEVHTNELFILAKDPEDARRQANRVIEEDDPENLVYSHTMDPDDWYVGKGEFKEEYADNYIVILEELNKEN